MEEANSKIKELMHQLIEIAQNAKDDIDGELIAFAKSKGLNSNVIGKIEQVLHYINNFSEKRNQLETDKEEGLSKEEWFENELDKLQEKLGQDSNVNLREVLEKAHKDIALSKLEKTNNQ